jgi:MFS family permease
MGIIAREVFMATPPQAIKKSANLWLVLVFLSLGFFMILLDTTIVNVAIPSIIPALHSSLEILWVLNAYLLVYAVLLITFGRLGDIMTSSAWPNVGAVPLPR